MVKMGKQIRNLEKWKLQKIQIKILELKNIMIEKKIRKQGADEKNSELEYTSIEII